MPAHTRLRAALACLFLSAVAVGPAAAEERVFVTLDHAKILELEAPASTIILGNPGIADATVFDRSKLVITGKSYGTTNLVVIGEDGEQVQSNTITVRADDDRLVTVHRGIARESYDCSPNCQPSLVLGDSTERFDMIEQQISKRSGSTGDTQR